MTRKQYDLAVFIGRMQPLHNGHVQNIQKALELAEHVLVIVGSANQPRTPKNPFTADERAQMVKSVFPTGRVQVKGVEDFYPDSRWLQNVNSTVHHHILSTGLSYEVADPMKAKVAILGHDKDHTSYYLGMFPQWDFIEIGNLVNRKEGEVIDATSIREIYLRQGYGIINDDICPREVVKFLIRFFDTEEYKILKEEAAYMYRYRDMWKPKAAGGSVPYPVTFTTVDAVVVQSGHVLLVQRKTAPGKGLWALPGGFVNEYERLEDAAIRELREETKLKVPVPVLRGSIKYREVFDAPNRSLRGRTITHVYLFGLENQPDLPKVKGSDDAATARWFPLDIVDDMSSQLFEDHKAIIHTMVAKLMD